MCHTRSIVSFKLLLNSSLGSYTKLNLVYFLPFARRQVPVDSCLTHCVKPKIGSENLTSKDTKILIDLHWSQYENWDGFLKLQNINFMQIAFMLL